MSSLIRVVGWSLSLLAAGEALAGGSPASTAPIFPRPLHLTRLIDDPVGGRPATVEEYYDGNRAVTVAGGHVVIIDYKAAQVTEVDRDHALYSISSFEEVARARATLAGSGGHAAATSQWLPSGQLSRIRVGERDADEVSMTRGGLHRKIALDTQILLSESAFAVIRRSAYPFGGTGDTAPIEAAARRNGTAAGLAPLYALPLEESEEATAGGATVLLHNRVTRVAEEPPPLEVAEIPRGARLVPSHLSQLAAETDKLDRLPNSSKAAP